MSHPFSKENKKHNWQTYPERAINILTGVVCTWELEGAGWPRACRRVGVGATAGRRRRVGRVWRDGKGAPSAVLLERLWEGGVERHVRLIVTQVAELHQKTVLRVELAVSWHQNRRKH